MNIQNKEKRLYCTPLIGKVMLDCEISLILESAPPTGPGEEQAFLASGYFNNDPFKIQHI